MGSITIILRYTRYDGAQEQAEFENDVVQINLEFKGIVGIDLSPLRSCTSLQVLKLQSNQLKIIDLSPLNFCTSLQELYLYGNKIQTVDLSPLSSCASL